MSSAPQPASASDFPSDFPSDFTSDPMSGSVPRRSARRTNPTAAVRGCFRSPPP